MKSTPAELKALLPYVTSAQAEAINAVLAHGTPAKAAKALGQKRGAVAATLTKARARAAKRGFAPEYGWNPPEPGTEPAGTLPENFELGARSDFVDMETGKTKAAWLKSRRERGEAEAAPPDFLVSKVSQYTDGEGKLIGQWKAFEPEKAARWAAAKAGILEALEEVRGTVDPVACTTIDPRPTTTIYPLGDPHIGMLSWRKETGHDFDLTIAERDLFDTIDELVLRSPPSEIAWLINLGDYFHAQDNQARTPSHGFKLDQDSRSAKVYRVGVRIMRRLIDRLLLKHPKVVVTNTRGNHDPDAALWVGIALELAYEREPRVEIMPAENPYQFRKYGKNLWGVCHLDGAKPAQLGEIMARDAEALWEAEQFRVWFTGHEHHERVKEFPLCKVKTYRTLAEADYWHHHKGYRSGQSLCSETFDPEFGYVGSQNVELKFVRVMRWLREKQAAGAP